MYIKKNQFDMKFTGIGNIQKITYQYGTGIPNWFKPHLRNHNLLRHILFRSYRQMNSFIAIVGSVRSGKSFFGLRIGEDYYKEKKEEFLVKDHCSFRILPFLEWSTQAENSFYMVDEIQLEMGVREWFRVQNRVFNQFCDIQGWRRNVLVMPFPNISYIDKHLRFLLNYVVKTINQGKVKWYKVVNRAELGKCWLDPIGTIRFKKPSQKVIDDYTDMKTKFTNKQLDYNLDQLRVKVKPKFLFKNELNKKNGAIHSLKVPNLY